MFKKMAVLILLLIVCTSLCEVESDFFKIEERENIESYIVAQRSRELYYVLLDLIYLCDDYIDYWQEQNKNITVYLIKKGKLRFREWGDNKDAATQEIAKKIYDLEIKKRGYAKLLGKLQFVAEDVIKNGTLVKGRVKALEKDVFVVIDDILSGKTIHVFRKKEVKSISLLKAPSNFKRNIVKYMVGLAAVAAAIWGVYVNRSCVADFCRYFYEDRLVYPFKQLKNYFLCNEDDAFWGESVEDFEKSVIDQREILKDKIKDFVQFVSPRTKKNALDDMIEQAKEMGIEGFVHSCLQNASIFNSEEAKNGKKGWLEWVIGDRLFGMSPKAKFMEVEIKSLLSRLAATQMMLDAKRELKGNKLLLVLASFAPTAAIAYGGGSLLSKVNQFFLSVYQKKRKLKKFIFKISEILIKNVGREKLSEEDQGLICYFTKRLRHCSLVVNKSFRSSFEGDTHLLGSSVNSVEQKLQVLQYMRILLYSS